MEIIKKLNNIFFSKYFIIDFDTFSFDTAYKDLMTFCVSILKIFNENAFNMLKSEVIYKVISEVLLIVFKMSEYRSNFLLCFIKELVKINNSFFRISEVDLDNFLEQDWTHVIEPVWRWVFLYTDHKVIIYFTLIT